MGQFYARVLVSPTYRSEALPNTATHSLKPARMPTAQGAHAAGAVGPRGQRGGGGEPRGGRLERGARVARAVGRRTQAQQQRWGDVLGKVLARVQRGSAGAALAARQVAPVGAGQTPRAVRLLPPIRWVFVRDALLLCRSSANYLRRSRAVSPAQRIDARRSMLVRQPARSSSCASSAISYGAQLCA